MNTNQNHSTPVAIIGIACIFAKSPDLKSFLHMLTRGVSGISDPPPTHRHLVDCYDPDPKKPDHIYCNRGGFLPSVGFDPTEFNIPPNVIEATDTSQLLGLATAKKALDDAGYGEKGQTFDRSRASVILGVTGTQELVIPLGARLGHPIWKKALSQAGVSKGQSDQVIQHIADGYVGWQENSFPGLLGNVVAGRIANRIDLGGTNCVVDAACASSMGALHMALLELQSGRSDMVITGGVDTINDAFMHMCFSKTQILSASGDIRPFSKDADGTVLGEGIGLVVLKRLMDAEKDGDRIYAVIKGLGSASDGRSQSIYAPRPAGQARALRRAYHEAGVDPATVALVEAHGTGTRVGDQVEFQALCDVFGEASPNGNRCALGSVKSNIGHTKAAAGTAGLIKAALAVYHKVLPPTLKADNPDPKLGLDHSPFYINTQLRPWISREAEKRKAGVSAFGFGGSNFHAVLEEYTQSKPEPSWDGSIEIMAFSGQDNRDLSAQIDRWSRQVADNQTRYSIGKLAKQSRKDFRASAPHRLVMVLDLEDDRNPIARTCEAALKSLEEKGDASSGHVFKGQGQSPGKLAFLFPGQGSQYVGMGRDLTCCFPASLEAFEDASIHFNAENPLDDCIYPRISTDRNLLERQLRRTRIAQPAIGAVSVAMLKAVEYFGVRPEATCGHSFGELVALHAAGWLEQKELWQLARDRGILMAEAGRSAGEAGGMLAVSAPLSEIEDLVRSMNGRIVLANKNSPDQGVLSGTLEAVQEAERNCQAKGWRTIQLPVAAAFHSQLVAKAQKPFGDRVQSSAFSPTEIAVMSNTLGVAYPSKIEKIREILGRQLACPVDFRANIEFLYQAGVRTFLEIGPKAALTNLVRSTLRGQTHQAIALDQSAGGRSGIFDLACALAQLAATGHDVRLDRWEKPQARERKARMTISLSGANYRNPQAAKPTPVGQPIPELQAPAEAVFPIGPIKPEDAKAPGVDPVASEQPCNPIQIQKMDDNIKSSLQNALNAVQQGLSSLQALQAQTTQAHQKFLETQAEAGRTLQMMIQSTQQLAASALGNAAIPPAIQQPGASTVALSQDRPVAPETPAISSVTEEKRPPAVTAPSPAEKMPVAQPQPTLAGQDREVVRTCLLEVVSQLTGYPIEMLGLDMDIESDLGIDSIKRVEILSALEEKMPQLPQVTPDMMGTLKTPRQICDYLCSSGGAPSIENRPAADRPSDADRQAVQITLLEIVGQLTGYPAEMLGLDMDIESDLGIDSIKRVEILSALEEKMPQLPQVTPDMMGTLKTLGQICDYLTTDSPSGTNIPADRCEEQPVARPACPHEDDIRFALIDIVSRLTGYPAEMLGLDMDIESDLGIDSIKRVEILSALEEKMPDLAKVTPELMGTLKTLDQIIDYLAGPNQSLDCVPDKTGLGDQLAVAPGNAALDSPRAGLDRMIIQTRSLDIPKASPWVLPPGHFIGVAGAQNGLDTALADALMNVGIEAKVLSGPDQLRPELALAGLVLLAPLEASQAFRWAKTCGPLLNGNTGTATCFITVSALDGAFGFTGTTIADPLQGALSGLTKTAAVEWPEVRCLAIDIDPQWQDISAIAGALAQEIIMVHAHEELEIGRTPDQRWGLTLVSAPVAESSGLQLNEKDVVVITGGARGVTASAAKALVERSPCILALLGRSPAPQSEPAWLSPLKDENEIKRAIMDRQFPGQSPSPMEVEKQYRFWASNRQIQTTLNELKHLGASVHYYSTDINDPAAVANCVEHIRRDAGNIRGLIHGAGVLEDRLIIDKQLDQFNRVFDTKVAGLRNLMAALDKNELKYLVLFSSVSARIGNRGQADYAMANEVLNKTAHWHAQRHPHCKVVSINWGPWDGGMVTPSLKRAFLKNNVALIPKEWGAAAMVAEMSEPSQNNVEVVIGGALAGPPVKVLPQQASSGLPALSLTCKREVDLDRHPVLRSHLLDGRPVVPFALITEWLAHSALHANPGLLLHGMDNLRLFNGITLDQQKRIIRLMAGKASRNGKMFEVDVQISDDDQQGDKNRIHSSAKAILTDHLPLPPPFEENGHFKRNGSRPSIADIYDRVLFHGHDLRGIQEILRISEKGISASLNSAPPPAKWMNAPLRSRWIADPLVLDCAFQMAIIWCHEQLGQLSLPSFAAAYRQYCESFPRDGIMAVLEVRKSNDRKLSGDFTFLDKERQVLARLEGYEAIMTPGLSRAFKAA